MAAFAPVVNEVLGLLGRRQAGRTLVGAVMFFSPTVLIRPWQLERVFASTLMIMLFMEAVSEVRSPSTSRLISLSAMPLRCTSLTTASVKLTPVHPAAVQTL